MQHYDTAKHAQLTNATSESTENLEISLILSISTDLCHKNIMLGFQNGRPLKQEISVI